MTIWWCEVEKTGKALHAAFGEIHWRNYCVPHISERRITDILEDAHSGCGLRTIYEQS